ncbi:hypothetical protein ABOM_006295 [Aspergillus bombycis]|uniref:Uncharacterized protein n=1 Tax=Aspergillus bombycis TaxID=109264 RepID=A0A1F8A2F7_9EURO|nr:hypothetical protein ABOM_006295 [Aspergillus bombycis]OGM45599.1 hypothetical protein ABOM_006295 [Aspergillus bombycis]
MLALRDQENLVHAHQTVAASKPLNQGVKQLQPKTPGARAPKTPFKVPLNDENDPLAFGKKTVKGAGKQNGAAKPSVKDAFVTPMAETRQRAPLGMKTTNAKARGLQTPAPPAGAVKPEKTGKRASTQRVKKFAPLLEQSKAEVHDKPAEGDVPDIEYMPPKPKELPDIPDEITYDTKFPQFQPKNLALGLETVYGHTEIGPDGLTKRERKLQEDSIAYDKMIDDMILKQVESIGFEEASDNEQNEPCVEEVPPRRYETRRTRAMSAREKQTSNIPTVRARDAAAALSGTERTLRPRPVSIPKPKPRVASSLFSSRKPRTPINPSSMHHTAAVANSKTTVGYTKGRDVSSKLHGKSPSTTKGQPIPQGIFSTDTYVRPSGTPPLETDMVPLAHDVGHLTANLEDVLPVYEEDEESLNFQLTL